MTAIIVDDEFEAIENLKEKIKNIPFITVTGTFVDPLKAFIYIKENPVDIVFLDIEMYETSGIEIAKQIKDLRPQTNIIFVTGYSQYMGQAFSLRASGYLLKPAMTEAILDEIENLRYPVDIKTETGVYVQTFGNFEVFVNNKPLLFSLSKAKELFAYLIDRYGASVKTAEIAAILWEDKEYDRYLQNQTQKIISSMMQTLRNSGVGDIIIKKRNQRSIDKTKLECDYYKLLNGDVKAINAYRGEYMTNYSWAEMTAGALNQKAKII